MIIRDVEIKDAFALSEIYKPFVEKTAVTFEYIAPSEEEFKRRIKKITEKYPYLVAEDMGTVLGYCYTSCLKDREAYDISAEISIYINEKYHKKQIGTNLYKEMECRLRKSNIKNVYACIAYKEADDKYLTGGSIRFHEKMGYKEVGTFNNCGCKFGNFYSIKWMEKIL